jgi:hypothetical protein
MDDLPRRSRPKLGKSREEIHSAHQDKENVDPAVKVKDPLRAVDALPHKRFRPLAQHAAPPTQLASSPSPATALPQVVRRTINLTEFPADVSPALCGRSLSNAQTLVPLPWADRDIEFPPSVQGRQQPPR